MPKGSCRVFPDTVYVKEENMKINYSLKIIWKIGSQQYSLLVKLSRVRSMIRVTASLSPPPPFPVYLLHCTNKAKSYKTDLKKKKQQKTTKPQSFDAVQCSSNWFYHQISFELLVTITWVSYLDYTNINTDKQILQIAFWRILSDSTCFRGFKLFVRYTVCRAALSKAFQYYYLLTVA